MLKKIIDQLSKRGLTAWQVREVRKRSFQSFLAREEMECNRLVETAKYRITIFKTGKEDKTVMGISSVTVADVNIPSLDQFLNTALASAECTSNEPFELPEQPASVPHVEICDSSLNESSLGQFEERIRKAVADEKGVRLSSAEFFIDRFESRLVNSKGLDLSQEESLIHTEFILLARSEAKENEFINRYTRRYLSDFNLEKEIQTSARTAREATQATLPRTGKFPVVFSDEPLDNLFSPLIARASARLKYNHLLEVAVGNSVVNGKEEGETITLWSNNLMKGAVGSFKFDSYGTPAGRTCLIEKNKVKSLLADKRYGDYLRVPVSGELGNFELEPGTTPFSKLLDPAQTKAKMIYHIRAFSAFEPNAITGAFSAEIRAGSEITPQGTRPIKGGSVSGVLQKDLLACWLSQETEKREKCLVPQGILFKKLDIAGR